MRRNLQPNQLAYLFTQDSHNLNVPDDHFDGLLDLLDVKLSMLAEDLAVTLPPWHAADAIDALARVFEYATSQN